MRNENRQFESISAVLQYSTSWKIVGTTKVLDGEEVRRGRGSIARPRSKEGSGTVDGVPCMR